MDAIKSWANPLRERLNRRLLIAAGLLCWLGAAGLLLASRPIKAGVLCAAGTLMIVFASRIEAAARMVQARNLISEGEFEAALEKLNRAVKLAPHLVNVYLLRSAAYTGTSQLDLALADADEAVKIAPRQPQTLLNRARLYSYRGLHDDAILDLRAGIQANAEWANGYFELVQLQVRLQDYEASLATLRDLNVHSHSERTRYDALLLTGWVYEEKLRDLDGAIAAYTRAIPLLPDLKVGYLRRAHAYRSRGDQFQAAEDLLRAAQRLPTPEDAGQYHWLRAACYWGRYTITSDERDQQAWKSALEQSIGEDDPTFSQQSRDWLAAVRSKELAVDPLDQIVNGPSSPSIFPN
jgi:tetratricopeptide (TPR) repeat protein